MGKVLKVGLIGVGSIASRRHLPAWGKERRAAVVSISDVDTQRAKRVAAQFGIKRVYEDYREMIAKEELDICDICTRSGNHVSVAKICLDLGAHVISEKPMAMTYESGRELFEVIQSCPKRYTVVFNYRFTPPVIALRRLLCEGVLGEVESLRVQFCWKKPDHQEQFKKKYPNGILYEISVFRFSGKSEKSRHILSALRLGLLLLLLLLSSTQVGSVPSCRFLSVILG